jgi:capsule polysaccharide export protein KpsE/RkpR
LIKISVEDRDPKHAAALANTYVEELHKQTNRLAVTESAQRRLFFEKQLDTQKKLLSDVEAAFRDTQERTGIVQVSSQVESVIRALAEVRAEIASREVALSALRSGATVQNPDVVRLEAELTALREQQHKLEANAAKNPADPFIATSRVPKLGLEYLRALRDLKYNEALFELLSKQYEIARIDEAKDAPAVQIVDLAVPPEHKSWPPRAFLTISGALGFGILACVLALVGHRYENPADAEKLRLLRRTVFGSRRIDREATSLDQ